MSFSFCYTMFIMIITVLQRNNMTLFSVMTRDL